MEESAKTRTMLFVHISISSNINMILVVYDDLIKGFDVPFLLILLKLKVLYKYISQLYAPSTR